MVGAGGGIENALKIKRFEYDFNKEGGAVGDITLRGGKIPANAIVVWGNVWVEVAVVGTTSTVALKLQSAADVLAATAEASLSLNALLDTVPDFAAANAIRCTADRSLVATVAVNPLTAGKLVVTLAFIMPKTS